ncbi:MAG: endonuclease domain-containing protein [Reyranellaceae bacterium]
MPRPFRDVHTANARALRTTATEAESRLWAVLRGRRLGGFKFRRQYAIGDYVADFACIERGVIVELDGSQHVEQEVYDTRRSAWLESVGFRIVRIWNADFLRDPESAREAIWAALNEAPTSLHEEAPHPPRWRSAPSPRLRGEKG